MSSDKMVIIFPMLRRCWVPWILVLTIALSILLRPVDPMRGEKAHIIEDSDQAKLKEVFQLERIYSVVKFHKKDLDEQSAWKLASTIQKESRKYSLDPLLVLAVIRVESSFRHQAVSRKGARGLMQIRPFVARSLLPQINLGRRHEGKMLLDDPILNIKIGVFYLNRLKQRFRDMRLALTAYNWGPTEIQNRLHQKQWLPTRYARKVLAAYHVYSHHPSDISLIP